MSNKNKPILKGQKFHKGEVVSSTFSKGNVTYSVNREGQVSSYSVNQSVNKKSSFGLNVRYGLKYGLSIIFILILLMSFVRLSFGNDVVTLGGFLEYFSNYTFSGYSDFLISLSEKVKYLSLINFTSFTPIGLILGNIFKSIFSVFISVFSVLLYLAGNVVYLIEFCIMILRYVFI